MPEDATECGFEKMIEMAKRVLVGHWPWCQALSRATLKVNFCNEVEN